LEIERGRIEALPDHRARQQHQQQTERDDQPSDLVREVLEPHAIAGRNQPGGISPQQLEVARQRPHLSRKLIRDVVGQRVDRDRLGLVDRPVPFDHHPHRDQHVVEDRVRRQRLPERSANRVERARRADRRVDTAFVATDPHLIAPIGSKAVRRRAAFRQHESPADRPDRLVAEIGGQPSKGHGVELLSGVHEHDQFPASRGHPGVERLGLSPVRRQTDQAHAARFVTRRDVVARVGGPIRDHQDLQAIEREVQRQQILQLGLQDRRLVMDRHDHADRRRPHAFAHETRP
jgi:hypothetical protein